MPKNMRQLRAMRQPRSSEGAAKGGKQRATQLTPEERSESARAAALARWEKPRSLETTAADDGFNDDGVAERGTALGQALDSL